MDESHKSLNKNKKKENLFFFLQKKRQNVNVILNLKQIYR